MQSDRADREARIRERAYHIWVEEGRAHGSHDEHWRRAEQQIAEEEAKELTVDAVSSAAGDNPPTTSRTRRSSTRAPSEAGPTPPDAEPAPARRSRSKTSESDAPEQALTDSAGDS